MDPFSNNTIPVLEQVINFAQARHNVLAGNVANMDTPGYKVRDLSVNEFHDRLSGLIHAQKQPQLRDPYGNLPSVTKADRAMREVKDSTKDILYLDESNVGLEQQVLEISKNQSMHNMAIALLTSQYRLLNVAISEKV
jgi:flagellar basal-body rod protein FlgB